MDEKFDLENEIFFSYLNEISSNPPDLEDLLAHFPAFVGHVNLARFLSLFETYKTVVSLSGDVGDFGTYKGGSFFALAKFVKLLEPFSNTAVHGFDWFKGQLPGPNDNVVNEGKYKSSKGGLEELIRAQGLEGLMKLHDLDLANEFDDFLKQRRWLMFKLAFVDIGMEGVLLSVLGPIWDRLVPGGVLILDHFNHEASPTESELLLRVTGSALIEQVEYSRSPTAFVRKPA